MHAHSGDQIVIRGHHVGDPERTGEVLEAHGRDGEAPYLVRWDEDGHQSLFFPGSDAYVRHLEHDD